MPTSTPSPSLISTPFSCPQAPPFEYPYPTPNSPSVPSLPYTSPNAPTTFPFPFGSNLDYPTDHLRGNGFPIWKYLSKTKGINISVKPPIPPGLMHKAAPSTPSPRKSVAPESAWGGARSISLQLERKCSHRGRFLICSLLLCYRSLLFFFPSWTYGLLFLTINICCRASSCDIQLASRRILNQIAIGLSPQ